MSDHITVKGEQYFHVSYLVMANGNCERRDAKIKELEQQCYELREQSQTISLLLAELNGIYTGLMMHPSDTPINGCLITEASKEKLKALREIISRYEQL